MHSEGAADYSEDGVDDARVCGRIHKTSNHSKLCRHCRHVVDSFVGCRHKHEFLLAEVAAGLAVEEGSADGVDEEVRALLLQERRHEGQGVV